MRFRGVTRRRWSLGAGFSRPDLAAAAANHRPESACLAASQEAFAGAFGMPVRPPDWQRPNNGLAATKMGH